MLRASQPALPMVQSPHPGVPQHLFIWRVLLAWALLHCHVETDGEVLGSLSDTDAPTSSPLIRLTRGENVNQSQIKQMSNS